MTYAVQVTIAPRHGANYLVEFGPYTEADAAKRDADTLVEFGRLSMEQREARVLAIHRDDRVSVVAVYSNFGTPRVPIGRLGADLPGIGTLNLVRERS